MKQQRDWQLFVILFLSILFRVLFLSIKPPHFDEGINGWFVDQVIENGFYNYDPTNYHGPLHFYILFFFKILLGRSLFALRIPSVLMGIGSVYLIARLRPYIGKGPAYIAALFSAVSPGLIFYSRYAIHEADMLFFSLVAIHGFFRFQFKKDKVSLWLLMIGMVGMMATKETYFIHIGTFIIAIECLRIFNRWVPSTDIPEKKQALYTSADLRRVAGVGFLILFVLFTGFFHKPAGILDFLGSLAPWVKTGNAGNGHGHPFFYWAELMRTYEWSALLGLAFLPLLLFPSPYFVRLIGIYGFGNFLAFSIINYKTPWCISQLLWPFFIVFGFALTVASRRFLGKALVAAVLSVVFLSTSVKAYDLNFFRYADDLEPYVYVQTYPDIMKIFEIVQKASRSDLSLMNMKINFMLVSHWPLPWMFGEYTNIGYYTEAVPKDPDAALILVDVGRRLAIENHLKNSYYVVPFRLRSAQEPSVAFFDAKIFSDFFGPEDLLFNPQEKKGVQAKEVDSSQPGESSQ